MRTVPREHLGKNQLAKCFQSAKINQVGNTAYKTGQRLPAAPFSQCNELLAFVLFQIGKVSHDVRCPEKAADVESFFPALTEVCNTASSLEVVCDTVFAKWYC